MASIGILFQITYFLIIMSYIPKTFSELNTALIDLEKLVTTEKYVIDNIENYVHDERRRIYVLRKLLKSFKEEYNMAKKDVTDYLANPLNAFMLIKRQTVDYNFIEKTIEGKTAYNSLRDKTSTISKAPRLTFPTRGDVNGALEALARLQRVYKFNLTTFASGKTFGENSASLTSSDCYKIGGLEYKAGNFNESIEWLTEALRRYKTERVKMYPFTDIDIMEYISYAYLSLDDIKNALLWNNKLKLKPIDPRYIGRAVLLQKLRDLQNRREYEKKLNERRENNIQKNPSIRVSRQNKLMDTFIELCRGDGNLPSQIVKRLKCSYFTEHHPFLRLAPLKMELLYLEPDLVMFHGVMSDDEIDHIKTLAKSLLRPKNHTEISKSETVSKNAWFKDEASDVIARVSRRVSDMTGMVMLSAEKLQVINYGIGGHDEPKKYYLKNNTVLNESRKASVIFYMTEVALGGATVFTELGLKVYPVKGAAIYWQNLHLSRKGGLAMRDASCPVLFGSKWGNYIISMKMTSSIDLLQLAYFMILTDLLPRIYATEIFTALTEMEPLVKTHKSVIDNLENYINEDKKRLYVVRETLKKFKDEHKKAMEDVQYYIENPVNAYTLIKRLTTDLDFIEKSIRERTEYIKVRNMKFPLQHDLDGALQALARLQRTYNLNVTEFASGKLFRNYSSSLTSYDCYMIGVLDCKDLHFNESITWMIEALERYKTEQHKTYPFTEVIITDYIIASYLAMDDVDNALKWNSRLKLNDTDPRYQNEEQILQRYQHIRDKRDYEYNVLMNKKALKIHFKKTNTLNKLCRGEHNLPGYLMKRLKCRYFTGHHPFLRLAPLKLEQLYIKPHVYMFHGVISDAEIERVKTLAKPLLHRMLPKHTTEAIYAKTTRILQVAWLLDSESSMVEKVSRRVADMTGLSSASSEALQVANYGIGGFYDAHLDVPVNDTMNNERARIATVMFYLTDVEQGGATVFLQLGLTVFPVRGSAILWKNLHSSGNPDFSTFHAACPVLHGTKWVATKWFRQRGQELIRPCKLRRVDEVSIPKHHNQWWI